MTEHKISLTQLARARDGSGHSVFGPSGSAMYLHCAGSLIPNLLAPDDSGADAAFGSVAHSVTEVWFTKGKKAAKALIGTTQVVRNGGVDYAIEIDDDMLVHVQACVDWLEWLPGEQFYEVTVDFSDLTPIPRQTGTADFIAVTPGRLVVADHKFGKGHMVYAENNSQLMLYAYGALLRFGIDYDIDEIEIRIAQPRLDHFDSWVVSRADLMKFAKWAKERMAAAWVINAPRTPGEKQCQWCKVKTTCVANLKMQSDLMLAVFDDIGAPVTEEQMLDLKEDLEFHEMFEPVKAVTLSTADMAFLLPYRGMVERWWGALADELLRRAAAGENIPGYKMVESRSHRKFKSALDTVTALAEHGLKRSDLITEELASPADVEKKLRKVGVRAKDIPALLAPLVTKPPGKPTLASVADKRPAIADHSEEAFSDLTSTPETEEL